MDVTLRITPATSPDVEQSVFLSASIPDASRWNGDFDALEITDAVVSLARVFLTAGWRLVTAAHPTIAPLLLYVAAEFPGGGDRRVAVYQSALFEDVLPAATRRFEAEGVGTLVWTAAADGDRPKPGEWDSSLAIMRHEMLADTQPAAAIFVGGMQGISEEHRLFGDLRPGRPRYAVARPGGEARALARESRPALYDLLVHGDVYPAIWRAVLDDLASSN